MIYLTGRHMGDGWHHRPHRHRSRLPSRAYDVDAKGGAPVVAGFPSSLVLEVSPRREQT
jgi:hypothetical protein